MFYLGMMLGGLIGIFLAGLGAAAKRGDEQNYEAYIKHLEDKLAEYERWEAA